MTAEDSTVRCPDSRAWPEVVAGVIPTAESRELLAHASRCESCSSELRLALALLMEEDPPAAERAANRLKSLVPSLRLMSIAAAIILLAFAGWFQLDRLRQPPFAKLVQAYQSDRKLIARLPGAAYAERRIDRSSNDAQSSPNLLEAEAAIRRHLAKQALDPDWLHALAVAETLGRHWDQAIRTYGSAAGLGMNSAQFWAHYAGAYLDRGLQQDSALDLARALELSSKALQLDPQLTAALENRAVAQFHLHLYDAAIADIEAALRAESDPGWRRELEALLAQCRSLRAALLGADPPRPDLAETHFESALGAGELGDTALAQRLLAEHRDRWLLHAAPLAGTHARAVAFLARLDRIRYESRVDQYAALDQEFAAWLKTPLPPPLRTWRDFEWIYRLSHSGRLNECPDGAAQAAQAENDGYPWFASQIAIEFYTCRAGVGDQSANVHLDRALAIAQSAAYVVASVRATGIMASRLNNQGDYAGALDHVRRQLSVFIRTRPPARRAHEFFAGYRRAADSMRLHHLALAAAGASSSIAADAGFRVHEVMDLLRSGEYAYLTAQPQVASSYFQRAESRATGLLQGPDLDVYLLRARLGMVLARGEMDKLPEMSKLASANNLFFQPGMWLGFSRLGLESGNPEWAEDFLKRAARSNRSGLLRKDEDELRSLLTAIRLRRDDAAGALRIWALATPGGEPAAPASMLAILGRGSVLWDAAQPAANPKQVGDATGAVRTLALGTRQLALSPRDNAVAADSIRAAAAALHVSPAHSVLSTNGEALSFPWALVQGDESYVVPLPLRHASQPGTFDNRLTLFVSESSADSALPALRRLPKLARTDLSLPAQVLRRDAEATPSRFAAALAEPGILHFSGHAIRWRNRAALVLNPDPEARTENARAGLFTEDAIGEVRASLVFLAACSTAQYEDSLSILPGHIAEALIGRGAEWVVAALWDIDDAATSLFSRSFYAALRTGVPVPAAVAAGRRALRNTPEFNDPHYWAAFTLYHNQLKGFQNASAYQEI